MPKIRFAEETDLNIITEIYNYAILNTTANWNEQSVDIENRRQWFHQRIVAGFPILVAEDNAHICGYASYGSFRPFEGYKYSAELSIFIHPTMHGKGIGKKLLGALIDHAKANKIHILIAAIGADNLASIKLHEGFAFEKTAYMPEVGYKWGKWLDLVMMQKKLQ